MTLRLVLPVLALVAVATATGSFWPLNDDGLVARDHLSTRNGAYRGGPELRAVQSPDGRDYCPMFKADAFEFVRVEHNAMFKRDDITIRFMVYPTSFKGKQGLFGLADDNTIRVFLKKNKVIVELNVNDKSARLMGSLDDGWSEVTVSLGAGGATLYVGDEISAHDQDFVYGLAATKKDLVFAGTDADGDKNQYLTGSLCNAAVLPGQLTPSHARSALSKETTRAPTTRAPTTRPATTAAPTTSAARTRPATTAPASTRPATRPGTTKAPETRPNSTPSPTRPPTTPSHCGSLRQCRCKVCHSKYIVGV